MRGRFRHWPFALLLCAGAAFLIVEALLNHRALGTSYDLGIYDQVVWNLSHGRLFQTTLVYETKGTYDHFEPILILFAPLYWLLPDVRVLLVVQSLALALGAVPIYMFARYRFRGLGVDSDMLALLPAAIYLIYPPLHAANLNNFHEVALLPPLFGMALYGLLTGRRRMLWLSLMGCLLVKEDVTVTVLAFGLYIAALAPRGFRRRDGVILAAFALIWGVLVLYVFYPAVSGGMSYPFVGRRYSWLGASPTDAAAEPARPAGRGLGAHPPAAQAEVFVPIARAAALPARVRVAHHRAGGSRSRLPDAERLPAAVVGRLILQPPAAGVPVLCDHPGSRQSCAARISARVVSSASPRHDVLPLARGDGVQLCGRAAAVPTAAFFRPASATLTDRAKAAREILAQLPSDASVSTEWWLAPHASHRRQIYTLLARPAEAPEYQILELRETSEGAPIFPLAAADTWPPVYHEYRPISTVLPFQLSKLARSVELTPLDPLESQSTPLDVTAFAWLDGPVEGGTRIARPGETACLMLGWRRTGPLNRRYVLFAHLLRAGGPEAANGLPDIIAQGAHEPSDGRYPTTFWQTWTAPPVVLDEQQLRIPEGVAPGTYYVWVGAFDKETGDRIELGGPGKTMRLVTTLTVPP